jgi:glyoxylase-like metal-dependent hydrolase (beta-lactamase superfamily II)
MTPALPPYASALGNGLWCIDTGYHRPHYDAAYLMVEGGRAAFIDTGTNHAVPRLLGTLQALGLGVEAVDWVIPTHVHLDHAGGSGALMQALPGARMLLHPRGLRHLVDPTALQQAVLDIYGAEAVARDYGTLVPVDPARITVTDDGMAVPLGGRQLVLAHTPGHAQHHHCIWDEASRCWFTGDTFGVSYREFDGARGPWIVAISTPVQFDPPALRTSIQRLLQMQPLGMCLTHYGRVGDVQRLGAELLAGIDRLVALGSGLPADAQREARITDALRAAYRADARAHGCTQDDATIDALLDNDARLNAQGLQIWLQRQGL